MKCSILTVIVLSALTLGAAQAQEVQTVPVAPRANPRRAGHTNTDAVSASHPACRA